MNGLDISLFCAAVLLLFLATSATILRCIVRIRILNAFGIDDYLMISAAICYVLAESFVFDAVRVTHDKDIGEILLVLSRAMKSMYFGEIFYILTVWFLKLSIGAFLLRLVQKPIHMHLIKAVLVIVSLYSATYLFMVIFQCSPVDHMWKPFGKGKCLPGRVTTNTSYAYAAIIGASDLIFALLPVFVVWNLKMNMAMKLSVSGLLGLGSLAGITSFIRMPYIKALDEASALDFFKVTSRLAIWTCVEPGIGIFVGSLAALRPLFRKFLGGSSAFSRSSPTPNAANHYWPSSPRQEAPYSLANLPTPNKNKQSVISKVVEGIESRRAGKVFGNDSEEELYGKVYGIEDKGGGIVKTMEFKTVSEGSVSESERREKGTPTTNMEDAFAERGGFY